MFNLNPDSVAASAAGSHNARTDLAALSLESPHRIANAESGSEEENEYEPSPEESYEESPEGSVISVGFEEALADLELLKSTISNESDINAREGTSPLDEDVEEEVTSILLSFRAKLHSKWELSTHTHVSLEVKKHASGRPGLQEYLFWRQPSTEDKHDGLGGPMSYCVNAVPEGRILHKALDSTEQQQQQQQQQQQHQHRVEGDTQNEWSRIRLFFTSLTEGHSATDAFTNSLEVVIEPLIEKAEDVAYSTILETLQASIERCSNDRIAYTPADLLLESEFKCVARIEQLMELNASLQWAEGEALVSSIAAKTNTRVLGWAWTRWVTLTRQMNEQLQHADKQRWRLHAAANQDTDLHAWYHSLFYEEVYRIRGPFWYREAALPVYQTNGYGTAKAHTMTQLEESALANVLCSPETTYGDVAGQIYVVQALLEKETDGASLFALFQDLTASGVPVIKCPRSGRPAKKSFNLSFVEGSTYLTWAGKFGNQGVALSEVSEVRAGITTDVLVRTAKKSDADNYLSLICPGRTIDLDLGTPELCTRWRKLLLVLCGKETCASLPPTLDPAPTAPTVDPADPISATRGCPENDDDEDDENSQNQFEDLLFCAALGKSMAALQAQI